MSGPRGEPASKTPGGLPLRPVYGSAEGEAPGELPFTRGIHAAMYRERLWTFRQYAGFGSPSESNRRYRYLLEQGQTGLSVAFDLPTQIGYDPDDPLSLGEVGRVGVSIARLDDLDALFADIPLERVSVSMTINATAPILLAFLVALARRRGQDPAILRGTLQNDILKEFIPRRTYRLPVEASLRLVTDTLEFSTRELPRFNPLSVSGYHLREAGATAVQELAFTFANAIAYLEAARDRGLELATVAARFSFFFAAHNHLFEEIAKFRAARRLWARLLEERFQLHDPKVRRLRFHTQTAGSTLTWQEPENNAVRVTLQALAAVLGGTQSLHTNAIDEALSLPDRRTARTALRTQQIIASESGVAEVVDPLGGCPLIEELTDHMEARVREQLEEIDALGGAVGALAAGFQESLIEDEAYRQQLRIEAGELPLVGVNCFAEERGEPGPPRRESTTDSVQADELEHRLEEFVAWKASREAAPLAAHRARLAEAARGKENLLPLLVEGAELGATVGELMGTLAEVFGEYSP